MEFFPNAAGGWAAMVSPMYDYVDCYSSVEDLWARYNTLIFGEPIKAALPAFVWVNHFCGPHWCCVVILWAINLKLVGMSPQTKTTMQMCKA